MKKIILITILCASLMLITPLTSVAQENKISNNLSDKPDIDGLVVQIRTAVDEILQKYGHIPMVRSQCDVILNTLDWFPGNIVFCIILFILLIPLALLAMYFLGTGNDYYWQLFGALSFAVAWTLDSNCPPGTPFFNWPFQTIYTMLETKFNINTFDDCPCLQE